MRIFTLKNSDKGKRNDITVKLREVLSLCKDTEGEKLIEFEQDEYHFYQDFATKKTLYCSNTDSERFPEKYVAIDIEKQKNITIDGNGSRFIMHGKLVPVSVIECENIAFRNFSWDFPCAGTLEMKLTEVGKFHADFQLPAAAQWKSFINSLYWFEASPFTGEKYWQNLGDTKSHCVVLHNPKQKNVSRYSLTDSPFFMCINIKKLSHNKVRCYYLKKTPAHFSEGVIFEMCPNYNRDSVGSFFCQSSNLRVENVNVRYMHGFGFLSQMCENVSFINCNFTPDENSDRYCTSFADLIHVSGAKGRVVVDSCNFSNAHDDPINIHGTFTRVKKSTDKNTLVLEFVHNQQRLFKAFFEGDKVVFYKRDTFEAFDNEREFTVKSVTYPSECGNGADEMCVTFCEELPEAVKVKGDYVAENITYTPEVYIGHCKFSLIPTRGILCTTRRKTVIENNVFDSMTMASIFLSNDCNDWYESGAIHDMTIKNNIFYIRRADAFKGDKPAIYIKPIVADEAKCKKAVHRNIVIEDNLFYLEHSNAVNAVFCDNLVIRNNKAEALSDEKIKAFETNKCTNTVIEGNIFSEGITE